MVFKWDSGEQAHYLLWKNIVGLKRNGKRPDECYFTLDEVLELLSEKDIVQKERYKKYLYTRVRQSMSLSYLLKDKE